MLKVSLRLWTRSSNGQPRAYRPRSGILYFLQKASIGGEVAGDMGKFFGTQHAVPMTSMENSEGALRGLIIPKLSQVWGIGFGVGLRA